MRPKIVVLMVLVFVYDLSPVDLIPDMLPFFGGLDDAAVSTLAIWLAGRKDRPSP